VSKNARNFTNVIIRGEKISENLWKVSKMWKQCGWLGVIVFLALGIVLTGCSTARPQIDDSSMPDTATPPPTPGTPASPTAAPSAAVPSPVQNGPLSDQEAIKLMELLVEEGPPLSQAAIDRVVDKGDQRFIAVFIELMRAAETGLISPAGYGAYILALQTLSGQSFEGDWPAWVEWYGEIDLSPPPGFTAWKGKLLSRIDPRFENFLSHAAPARLRLGDGLRWTGF
jgi:hypothetical protein